MPVSTEDRPRAASIAVRTAAAVLGAYAVAYFLASALTGGRLRLLGPSGDLAAVAQPTGSGLLHPVVVLM